jgi:ribosomal protein L32
MSEYKYTIKTNCKFCGRLFDSFNLTKACPECSVKLESDFQRIKEHIEEFPDDTAMKVCEVLGIDMAVVTHFLKEERLILRNRDAKSMLSCEMCGKPIYTGRYCEDCAPKAARQELHTRSQAKKSANIEDPRFHTRNYKSKGKQ